GRRDGGAAAERGRGPMSGRGAGARDRGSALYLVLTLLLVTSLALTPLLASLATLARDGGRGRASLAALYAAEGGLARARVGLGLVFAHAAEGSAGFTRRRLLATAIGTVAFLAFASAGDGPKEGMALAAFAILPVLAGSAVIALMQVAGAAAGRGKPAPLVRA